jgi:zinc transport system ATP-binding protein
VNFDVHSGDFVSIIGPNGGGKTTLLKLLLGMLSPTGGKVRVFGKHPSKVVRRIGYAPQHMQIDPHFPASVRDVVATGCLGRGRQWGTVSASDKDAMARAMQETDVQDLVDLSFADLSGGQRQRVMIARALAGAPDLLLLDEPTASLDPLIQKDIYLLLKELNKRMTIIMVSHDVNMVSQHVNRVFCVNANLVEHCAAEITGELMDFFPGQENMKLVRHAHDHSHGSWNHE